MRTFTANGETDRLLAASTAMLPEWPAVIILNLFYTGLGIARDLAGSGVRVLGLSAHREIYGSSSRLCEVQFCPNSQEKPEQLAEFLLERGGEYQGAVIFPTRDADVLFLDRFRNELEAFYRLAIPPHHCLLRTIDKSALVQAALQAEVPVPRTVMVDRAKELLRVPEEVGFPCVVKPVSSVHWRGGNNWNLVGGRKAFRVDNLESLRNEYQQLSTVHPEVLVQEWIPGGVDQLVVLGGYVDEYSEPLAYFTARKIVQSPEDFGTGCIVESDHIPALLEPSIRLFQALGYQGMAEVEYKRDARTGEFKLIEINTRHWDWHRLASASGINLSWVAYCHMAGKSVVPVRKPIKRAKWIAEDALLLHVAESLWRKECRPLLLWRQFSGHKIYGIFSWRDPLPFLRYFILVLIPMMAKTTLRKIWKGIVSQ